MKLMTKYCKAITSGFLDNPLIDQCAKLQLLSEEDKVSENCFEMNMKLNFNNQAEVTE